MYNQKTLTEFNTVYKELKDNGYVKNHKDLILNLLNDCDEHSSDSVALAGGKQYNARILELRREGWDIKAIRKNKTDFNFKLISKKNENIYR